MTKVQQKISGTFRSEGGAKAYYHLSLPPQTNKKA